MTKYRHKIVISFVTALIFVFSCFNETEGLKQSDIKPIMSIFLARHVKYHRLDDEISEKTLHNIINVLDPGKYYFYESDIKYFNKSRHKIDDYVKKGKIDFAGGPFGGYDRVRVGHEYRFSRSGYPRQAGDDKKNAAGGCRRPSGYAL